MLFSEDGYASFKLLWLLLHSSRFSISDGKPDKCLIESHLNESRTQGERNRTELRKHVRFAIAALGNGFLAHPDNQTLHDALYKKNEERLSAQDYYTELLHVVYRLVFLLTLEDRDLLHIPGDSEQLQTARQSYAKGYSIGELRERSLRPTQDRYSDLWEARCIVFQALSEKGEDSLALPGLGGIFESKYLPHLEHCRLSNESFLAAVKELTWTAVRGQRVVVNWRDMGAEEFGGIYEGLLDALPVIDKGKFVLEDLDGTARKQSASYYTPDSLVQAILDSALEPVLDERIAGKSSEQAEKELLSLRVIDPACGSGHFLLGAARRIATKICSLRNDLSPEGSRQALREAVHCLHGVDLNPMAVELARMAIWLETHEAGKPLGFLGHRIQQGDALLGIMDLSVLDGGIPDEAYNVLSGDDKECSARLKKHNKKERELLKDTERGATLLPALNQEWHSLESAPEETVAEVHRKEQAFERLRLSLQENTLMQSCNLYTAAFLARKIPETENVIPTSYDFMPISRRTKAVAFAADVCHGRNVLHWPFAFPEAIQAGGFDVVLGNPPWEELQLDEEEFFSEHNPAIASKVGDERKKAISRLQQDDPELWALFVKRKQRMSSAVNFFRESSRFTLSAVGKINTYPLFSEAMRGLLISQGRAGFIVPSGIATDSTTSKFFGDLISKKSLVSLFEFENNNFFQGAGKGHMVRFALVTITGHGKSNESALFLFQGKSLEELHSYEKVYSLSKSDIELVNANTLTAPIFKSKFDAELTKKIYREVPILARESEDNESDENPWRVTFSQGLFNITSSSGLFKKYDFFVSNHYEMNGNWFARNDEIFLPLYEAKMVHLYNHRFGDFRSVVQGKRPHVLPTVSELQLKDPAFQILPYYWVNEREVRRILERKIWNRKWFFGWRDVTDSRASARTLIAAFIPWSAVSDGFLLMMPDVSVGHICILLVPRQVIFYVLNT